MSSLNKVTLIGNLGSKPELEEREGYTQARVGLATTERYKNKAGEQVNDTEWHNLFFYGRQAEVANQYLVKGSKLYVEGRIKNKKFTDKDGIERIFPKVIVTAFKMLDSKDSKGRNHEKTSEADVHAGFDDDIPF